MTDPHVKNFAKTLPRLLFAMLLAWCPATISAEAAMPGKKVDVSGTYGTLPLSFEVNQGQTDARVKFLSRGRGYSLFLTTTEAVLSLKRADDGAAKTNLSAASAKNQPGHKSKAAVMRISLAHSNSNPKVSGVDELPGKSNYFIGKDPRNWQHNVPTFRAVKYREVYAGVDLVYHGSERRLEYDFVVAPQADPKQIELSFGGVKSLRLDKNGNLHVDIAGGEIIQHAPIIYQEIEGVQRRVAGGYELRGEHRVGFKLSAYDRHRRVTIDPTLVYSTFLGGSLDDFGTAIAVDSSGSAYVLGYTNSYNFPATAGAYQFNPPTPTDVFVSKLSSDGSALVYSTYLGGSSYEEGHGVAVDSAGNAYVVGYTGSSDFPTTPGALQGSIRGEYNAFVSKLSSDGSALIFSTYLGGNVQDVGTGIAVDSSGNVYVTGGTYSSNFPVTAGAFQGNIQGSQNAFVSKMNGEGSALLYSTYLGGAPAMTLAMPSLSTLRVTPTWLGKRRIRRTFRRLRVRGAG